MQRSQPCNAYLLQFAGFLVGSQPVDSLLVSYMPLAHSDSDFFHLNLSPNRQIARPQKVEPVIPILTLRGTKERGAAG